MFLKEITGIYLGETTIEYSSLKRQFRAWRHSETPVYAEITGRSPMERLNNLLSGLKPRAGRKICISIPRSRYFIRELSFQGITAEEAENSAKIAIGIHSHLPKEDIYFDVWATESKGMARVLLVYARRTYIDQIIETVKRTGHRKSLGYICPSGLGTDLLLRYSTKTGFPALSIQEEDQQLVLNLHGEHAWEGSHAIKGKGDSSDISRAIELLPVKFKETKQFFRIGDTGHEMDGLTPRDPCSTFQSLADICNESGANKGLAACFPATVSYPQICFQDRPRKRPISLRINALQWAAVLFIVLLVAVSGIKLVKLYRISAEAAKAQKMALRLEKQYEPLLKTQEKIQKLRAIEQDMRDFLRERPPVLAILRELAERTPLDAWIRSCSIRGVIVRVSAEGGSAVATMEEWRKSPLFEEVKLASPVTKNRKQQERYTVELRLKIRGGKKEYRR